MRDSGSTDSIAALEAVARLLEVASKDTGQSRRVADFLLAWHNAAENGGWDPVGLWNVDKAIANDMLTVLRFLVHEHTYPDGLGFKEEIAAVWLRWRGDRSSIPQKESPA